MPEESGEIDKVKENPVLKYFYLLILLGWIVFAVYMIEVNKAFFGISIAVAVIFSLFIRQKILVLTDQALILKEKMLIPVYSKQQSYPVNDITDIKYHSKNLDSFKEILLKIGIGPEAEVSPPQIFLTLTNGKRVTLNAPKYEDQDNKKLVEEVKAEIRSKS